MTLTEELNSLLEIHADSFHAHINANSCGTQRDREIAYATDHKYDEALEKFEKRLGKCTEPKG